MKTPVYVVITPVRDEASFLPGTISSMREQTVLPLRWVIVNDGSRDATGSMADQAATQLPFLKVVHRSDRGKRKSGGGVIEAFYDGYGSVEKFEWDFLVKLDGDLSFERDYFERCFQLFDLDRRLGVGGGTISNLLNGVMVPESTIDPAFHVRGATKIYRLECWQQIGGLVMAPGWDALDELKANQLGWTTRTFQQIPVRHHRPEGRADGAWNTWVKGGLGNYIAGYHPVFMFLKVLRRLGKKPYGIGALGLVIGYLHGYIHHIPQVHDKALVQYIRDQQMNRIRFRKSLWGRQS